MATTSTQTYPNAYMTVDAYSTATTNLCYTPGSGTCISSGDMVYSCPDVGDFKKQHNKYIDELRDEVDALLTEALEVA